MIEKIIQGFYQSIAPFIPTNKQFIEAKNLLCASVSFNPKSREITGLLVIPELKIETCQ